MERIRIEQDLAGFADRFARCPCLRTRGLRAVRSSPAGTAGIDPGTSVDILEPGLQGQVPLAEQLSGRAAQGHHKGLRLIGQNSILDRGANFSLAWLE